MRPKITPILIALGAALLAAACGRPGAQDTLTAVEGQWQLLNRYCTDCHNSIELVADVSFDRVRPEQIAGDQALWEHVVRKLRGDLMPPPGGPRMDQDAKVSFVRALETHLDALVAQQGPIPGFVPAHRLNRTEYATAVQDLLGVRIDARDLLPADVSSEGLDNIAEVLRVSPTHIDRYIAAARDISILAVGNPQPEPARADYRPAYANQTVHVAGLPLGTRGGMSAEHYFPADGIYEFNINVNAEGGTELRAYPQGWIEYPHNVVVTIDGVKVFEGELGGEADSRAIDQLQIEAVDAIRNRFRGLRLHVPAGHRTVGAAFIQRSFAESDKLLQSLSPGYGVRSVPQVFGIEIVGPYEPTGISGTIASRDLIFVCYPENEAAELPCAEEILANLARRAFRRPVTNEDMDTILAFYRTGHEIGGFERGVQHGLMSILASTKFLYRVEPGAPPAQLAVGEPYRISDLELAWRLAFFLWSQGPDERLLELAEQGRLSEPTILDSEIERMLADERSRSLVTNFAFQWLSVRRLDIVDPDSQLYPNFDDDLRQAFVMEMELFLDSILRNDRSVLELLDARHTFLNERLARHYGVPSVRGPQFREVALEDSRRWGLFGKGAILMVTSYPDRTSPVLRGEWIMAHLLGAAPAPPPPGVETDLAQLEGDRPRSVRERLELHRSEPSCNQCHGVIDPLGQALEHFNVIGEWRVRERDTGVAVDATGELANGIYIDGPEDLRRALLANPDQVVQALTEKLMKFAIGRGLEYYDYPTVRAIVREAARENYRFSSLVKAIVHSVPFQMRSVPPADAGDAGLIAAQGTLTDR
jgi:hypothetical protein